MTLFRDMKKAGIREDYIKKYNLRKMCSCGTSIVFRYNQDLKICRSCGRLHYRTDNLEFRYTLLKLIK